MQTVDNRQSKKKEKGVRDNIIFHLITHNVYTLRGLILFLPRILYRATQFIVLL